MCRGRGTMWHSFLSVTRSHVVNNSKFFVVFKHTYSSRYSKLRWNSLKTLFLTTTTTTTTKNTLRCHFLLNPNCFLIPETQLLHIVTWSFKTCTLHQHDQDCCLVTCLSLVHNMFWRTSILIINNKSDVQWNLTRSPTKRYQVPDTWWVSHTWKRQICQKQRV